MPMMLKVGLFTGALLYTVQLASNLLDDVLIRTARRVVLVVSRPRTLRPRHRLTPSAAAFRYLP